MDALFLYQKTLYSPTSCPISELTQAASRLSWRWAWPCTWMGKAPKSDSLTNVCPSSSPSVWQWPVNSLTTGLGLERASEQHIVHNTWQCSLYTISKSKRGHHTLCSANFSTTHSNFCFTDSLLFWPITAHLFRLTINSIVSSQYPHKIFPTSQNIANQGARGLLTCLDFNGRDA